MSRIRRILAAGAIAGIALTGLAGSAAAGPGNPNDPLTYGPDCTKVEYVDGTTSFYVAPGTTVYIKVGTQILTFSGGLYGQTVYLDKDISFVITCPGPVYPPS